MSGVPPPSTRVWLLTGEPASGKSTALSKILLAVRSQGFVPGGVLTREMRSHGEREGFLIVDISSEESRVLASVKGIVGPRIGKYRVDLNALSSISVSALEKARDSCDLIACDEVGPMELLSPDFRRAVQKSVVDSSKPSVCIVHKRFEDPLIEKLRSLPDASEIELTFENRDEIAEDLANDIIEALKQRQRK